MPRIGSGSKVGRIGGGKKAGSIGSDKSIHGCAISDGSNYSKVHYPTTTTA